MLFILFAVLANSGFAQCSVPIVVDLSGHADTTYTQPGSSRSGNCCGGSNCISYKVLINPQTDVLAITSGQFAASDKYYLDCAGPYNVNQSACISGLSSVIITFCKPGNNKIDITFTTTTGISTSPDINLRQGCTGTMSVTGLQTPTITWTSIYPGAQGAYNSYLSQTSGVSTVNVTPTSGSPAYIDYKVTGIEQSPCSTLTKSDMVRVYTYNPLTVSVASSNPTICAGSSVTLTATVSGGKPAYSYLWSNGATTPSITVSTAGTYSVSVNDQSDQSATAGCGAINKSITMTVTNPVAPTAPPVTICTGNTATLNATGPGGPYQWYDVNHNSVCACTSASITTPVLTSSTTYYVSTTFGGCQSPETAIPVTVSPAPPPPADEIINVCGTSVVLNSQTIACYSNPTWSDGSSGTTFTASSSGTYWWQVTGTNIVTNGDFSSGNAGFTSSYSMPSSCSGCCCGILSNEGTYGVNTNPRNLHTNFVSMGDHTSGTGKMLVVNGASTANVTVWQENITIQPNTNYVFSVWATSVTSTNPAVLQFSINGGSLGTIALSSSLVNGTWQYFTTVWNSGSASGTVPIALVNQNTASSGNDFAIDDIVFAPVYRQNVIVNLNPIPVLTLSGPNTGCSSYDLTQTISGYDTNTYLYTFTDPSGKTVTDPQHITQSGTYTITEQNKSTGCQSLPKTTNVTILPTPPSPTASSVTICNNTTATLTASGAVGATYQWYNSAGTLVGNSASYTTSALSTGTYNYTVTATVAGCASTPTPVTVTVLPTPAGPTASSVTICNNTTATLTASGAVGATYQWYNSAGTQVGNSASYTTSTLTTGTYNYTVIATVAGCPSTPTPVTVTVLPTPAAPTASSVTICNNTAATLTATAPGGPYQWYNSAGTLVSSSASYTTPVLSTGTYNYTVMTSFGGCPSSSTTVTVTVLPTPAAPTASSVTICNNTAATLTATAPGGPYQWYNSAGTLVSSSASYTTPVLSTGTYTYTVMTSFGGCPSSSTTVTVTVLPTPAAPTVPPATICDGFTATLTATAPGGPYQWYDSTGTLVGTGTNYTTPVLTTGAANTIYNYTVTTSFGGCPSQPTTVPVTVTPTPTTPTVQSQ